MGVRQGQVWWRCKLQPPAHDERSPEIPVSQNGVLGGRVEHLYDLGADCSQVAHLWCECQQYPLEMSQHHLR